jgi:3-oxoacyl-[acyl-carrier protein] reductase
VLDGKVAIVTGSARGIGRATAGLLAEHGARVLINDLDADAADRAAGEIRSETAIFTGDLTRPGVPEGLVGHALEQWGAIDILVNNAGYTLDAPSHEMSDEWFQRMMDIHVLVPFRLCRALAPHLRQAARRERAQGQEVFRKIVNVSSIAGTMGHAGSANYSSAKAAVVGLTKALADEWGKFKVNVNAVAFGFVDTRLTGPVREVSIGEERLRIGVPGEVREGAAADIPLGRLATSAEAAGGVFLLCSPWSNYIHGQVLTVSGGQAGGMVS